MTSRTVRSQSDPTIGAGSAASLTRFTSTSLATEIGIVTREVTRRGAAIITRHDVPVMVLVSLERYAELEKAAAPDLAALTSRFDRLYARMQSPEVAGRTIEALDLVAGKVARRKAPARGRVSRGGGPDMVKPARARTPPRA